ncbi:MAG: gamma-glutamyltransferase [Dysosmobacter sp.]
MRFKKLCALLLAGAMTLSLAACGQKETPAAASSSAAAAASSSASSEEPEKVPAYSVEGFETVDADGNRITTGRDATATQAMASASKYEVSQVGAEIMEKGGNAVDAAVAMGFALGVCEPFTSGLGGGGLCTIHTADGQDYFIDFREVAPAAATLDLYLDAEGKSNGSTVTGGLASGVPGEVAGLLYLLENYGTMTREEVISPAIRIATEGFTVSRYCANAIADAYDKAVQFPEMQSVYWDENGLPYEEGDVITNPGLAKALQKIVDEGRDGFYKGEVAEALVQTIQKYGGVMTLEDLANYEVQVHEPVTSTYRGYKIISSPPPSSGGTHLIEILNILENFDVGSLEVNSPEYIHLFAEAFKLSYADRAQYMADTNFVPDVPLTGLTSKEYAKERAALIDLDQAQEFYCGDPTLYEHTDTTHYSVADVDGNCVAITKTINYYFGSGVMVGDYGFMMNNQMDDFSTNPESVNKVEPGKKPLSSMSPTVVLNEDGSPFMVLGTPGGARIFASVAQVISRVIDHNIPLHDAISIPKIWNNGGANNLQYENALKGYEDYAVTDETLAKLVEMGHGDITTAASGAVQAIEFLEDGTLYGTADPRQDGKAVGVSK